MKIIQYLVLIFFLISLSLFSQENKSFELIEERPVFKGCKGDASQLKTCFDKKFNKHFKRRFNTSLPSKLNLSPGKKTLYIHFRINSKGKLDSIKVLAPHPKLELEVKRVLKKFPRLKPGRLRGVPVPVIYTVPIYIYIEETKTKRKKRKKRKESKN